MIGDTDCVVLIFGNKQVVQHALVASQHAVRGCPDQATPEPELGPCDGSGEYFSCSDSEDVSESHRVLPRQVQAPSGCRDEQPPGLFALPSTPVGKIRKQTFRSLSLQFLQKLSGMQRKDPSDQQPVKADHVLPFEGLQQNVCAGTTALPRWKPCARRWGPRSHRVFER